LHDRGDASAIRILNAFGRAADQSGRLLPLELVFPGDDVPHSAKIIETTRYPPA
jgi:hypothetical protein